jgi:hypothetical protein
MARNSVLNACRAALFTTVHADTAACGKDAIDDLVQEQAVTIVPARTSP